MAQLKASLDLDWMRTGRYYVAELPVIPGYTDPDKSPNYVEVMDFTGDNVLSDEDEKDGRVWGAYFEIGPALDGATNKDFGIPFTATADEMMDAIDSLTPEEIADRLAELGYVPISDATASRHATRRTASMDLDWVKNGDDYVAELPAIPYYTDDTGNGSFVTVAPYDFYGEKHWKAVFTIIVPDGKVFKLNNTDLGLSGKDTADEMMEEVESLRDSDEITYALYMEGYPNTVSFQGGW